MSTLSADTHRRITDYIANLGSADQVAAQLAEAHLLQFGSKAVELLMAECANPDPQVRFRSAWILGKSRDARALPILQHLTDDPDEQVRYDAALALGVLGDRRAIPLLTQLAEQPEDEASLESAARMALTKLGS